MTGTRKTFDVREKELRLAIFRIERGRAHTKASKLSIASVAAEAGVSPALIHNHYPVIAEKIRETTGRSSRQQRDAKDQELKAERERNRELRKEVAELRRQVSQLASLNEVLQHDHSVLLAKKADPKVIDLVRKKQ